MHIAEIQYRLDVYLLATLRFVDNSKYIAPSFGCSKPAMERSNVVFPQPDGPSRVINSPCLISRDMLNIPFDKRFFLDQSDCNSTLSSLGDTRGFCVSGRRGGHGFFLGI